MNAKWGNAREAFLRLDVDRSGKLEPTELAQVLRQLHIPVSSAVVAQVAANLGAMRAAGCLIAGAIDYDRFVRIFDKPQRDKATRPAVAGMTVGIAEKVLVDKLRAMHSKLLVSFRALDRDNSGSIDMIEFADILRKLNINVSATDMQQLFNRFDMDGNNTIEYQEFVHKLEQWPKL